MSRIVAVGQFPNAGLAELARGYLAEQGIEAEVSGALAQSWAGGDVPLFGVRLEVRAEDAERARGLLNAVEAGLPGAAREHLVEPFEAEPGDPADPEAEDAEEVDEQEDPPQAPLAARSRPADALDSAAASEAGEAAQRLWRGGIASLLVPPLGLYVLAKFAAFVAAGGLARVPPSARWRALLGGLLALLALSVAILLWYAYSVPGFAWF